MCSKASAFVSAALVCISVAVAADSGTARPRADMVRDGFLALHADYHTADTAPVGRGVGFGRTVPLIRAFGPDVIQMHAKGAPGWTTYPTEVGERPDNYRNDVLDLWRQIAKRQRLGFSAYYNLGRDRQILRKHPGWARVNRRGEDRDMLVCFNSPAVTRYLLPMVREIQEKYEPDGFWFDGSVFTVTTCYCRHCRDRFRRETARGTPPGKPGDPHWAAFHAMHRSAYRQCLRRLLRTISEADPDCRVAVNWAYSLRMPESPSAEIAYLTGDVGNRVEAISPEAHWYDAADRPFEIMTAGTCLAPAAPDGRVSLVAKSAVQLQQEIALVLANGGRYSLWANPDKTGALYPDRLRFYGRNVTPFVRSRQPFCEGSERVAELTLLHAAADQYARTVRTPICFGRENSAVDAAAAALVDVGISYAFCGDWMLDDLDVARPLLVNDPITVDTATAAGLERFARRGGRVLLTGEYAFEKYQTSADAFTGGRLIVRRGEGTLTVVRRPIAAAKKSELQTARNRAIFDELVPPSERLVDLSTDHPVEVNLRRQPGRSVLHLVNTATGDRVFGKPDEKRKSPRILSLPAVPDLDVTLRLPARPAAVVLQPQNETIDDWSWKDGRVRFRVPSFDVHQMVCCEVAAGAS